MKTMKKFLIYALIIAAFWIFTDVMINLISNGKQSNNDNIQNINSQQQV